MEHLPHTQEGIMLAIYKMSAQNNAILKTLINVHGRIYAKLQEIQDGIPYPDAQTLEKVIEEFSESVLIYSTLIEPESCKQAWDFAVEHDSNLDFDNDISQS